MYDDEVDAFKERLTKRAKTKRDAALAEAEAEERARRVQESPGGMDPQEGLCFKCSIVFNKHVYSFRIVAGGL